MSLVIKARASMQIVAQLNCTPKQLIAMSVAFVAPVAGFVLICALSHATCSLEASQPDDVDL
jgi:hypothetical protein